MSQELVPTSYDRNAYNTLHGIETRHHNDILTAEQARQINDNFDVVIAPVAHGWGLESDPDALKDGNAPSVDDYNHTKNIVDQMNPGDVLLVEAVGFDSETDAGKYFLNQNLDDALGRAYESHTASDADYTAIREAQERLEYKKDNYMIDAVDYAIRTALLNRKKVVFADIDVYDVQRLDSIIGDNRNAAGAPLNPEHEEMALEMRDKRAVNTTKDLALEMLGDSPSPRPADGQKTKLVLMYGSYHAHSLQYEFENLGIAATILPETASDPAKRHAEILGHLAMKQAA